MCVVHYSTNLNGVRTVTARNVHSNYTCDQLADERSPTRLERAMFQHVTHFSTAVLDAVVTFAKDMIARLGIASITEWPVHREW